MAVTSAVPKSCTGSIPPTSHAMIEKVDISACLIYDRAKFDGVSAEPPFSPALVRSDGCGATY